jgi:hypothetical protein
MTRCRAGKGGGGAHFRVITQSGARSLGPRDPGQPIAIQDRKAHKLTRHLRHPVQDRLGNVDDARGAQKAEPHRHQLGGQSIGAMVERLTQIAVMDQFVEQPVRGAARQVQPLGHHTQGNPRARPTTVRGWPGFSEALRTAALATWDSYRFRALARTSS